MIFKNFKNHFLKMEIFSKSFKIIWQLFYHIFFLGGQAKSSSPRKNTQGSDKLGAGGGEGSSSKTETEAPQTGSAVTEYTCCHCLLQTAATESRPIGKIPDKVFFPSQRWRCAVVNVKIETLMYLEMLQVTKRV